MRSRQDGKSDIPGEYSVEIALAYVFAAPVFTKKGLPRRLAPIIPFLGPTEDLKSGVELEKHGT